MGTQWLGLVALIIVLGVAVRFAAYCLADLARTPVVRILPRNAWALLIVITIPLGGLLYLTYGKVR